MDELIKKYDRPGPRYTSYPAVPFWTGAPTSEQWFNHLNQQYHKKSGVDLYIHIPFCKSLCFYCGCNRNVTKNQEVEKEYIDALIKEWSIYQQNLGDIKIHSIHLGGGTPTFLTPKTFNKLMDNILQGQQQAIGSIEVDPRTCTIEHLQCFKKYNFQRISLGIQDFDLEVQKKINRVQDYNMVAKLVSNIRQLKFESLNFDLIHGLPKQSITSMDKTFRQVIDLKPDMIAFYSYAHVPWKVKNQSLIKSEDLPQPELKRSLYELAKKILLDASYSEIGIDHFALPHSFLTSAKEQKKLKRSFMGYTDNKSNMTIALGASSISDSGISLIQNDKELKNYYQQINKNVLPIIAGHTHSAEDLILGEFIQDLMCNGEASLLPLKNLPFWPIILEKLLPCADDQLIHLNQKTVSILDKGRPFCRNIAMCFDPYLMKPTTKKQFSQTI